MLVNDESFITIQGWMVNKLGLERNEIMVFAIVYGFSKDGQGWYEGSRKYISEWTGYSTRVVSRAFKSLYEKELIKKEEIQKNRTLKLVRYQVNLNKIKDMLDDVGFKAMINEYDKVASEFRKIEKLNLSEDDMAWVKRKVSNNIHHRDS